jgi:hypothetical protein
LAASTNLITINTPASLLMSMVAIPSGSVGTGENITFIMSVSNTGYTQAVNVSPTAMLTGGSGTVAPLSGPAPTDIASIAYGADGDFTWIYQPTGTGDVWFSVSAIALDNVSGLPVTLTPDVVGINKTIDAAAFINIVDVEFSVSPTVASVGQNVTVWMTVSNEGTGTSSNVIPSALMTLGAGDIAYL